MLSWIDNELKRLEQNTLRRTLATRSGTQAATITLDDRPLINFGSNDYLGLSGDPRLIDAAIASLRQEGLGTAAPAI